ncbi:PICOT family protein [Ascoidea rubescens DSM 1968]|uniref:Hydroperoxide and superoxide-radical responsive glutathione-dependent oxidoreductase n=1 Tax=Ascoidea rubescens DSM 1968 TaxID=1344418 RepID=A0A1D2VLD5_9ASCO|nr:hydroperoxide and superoxide-radical responsive glutathione-dependent oxidoreductase [Ascoidea rubescens DSM 1968]ODV62419.1 hydroperoxide and superoxide-radical responsive glutathione-dependent oxidoreductase [Ascoidea rubescens DSM 1968]
MSVTTIESESQFTDITNSTPKDKLLSLYFSAKWAAPCIQMNKVFITLADANPNVSFISIDADNLPDIAELFEVQSVPHFVFIKNGTILKELSGADPKQFASTLNFYSSQDSSNENPKDPSKQPSPKESSSKDSSISTPPSQPQSQLKKITCAAQVMLFMKGTPSQPKCGFSRQVVAILRENKVRFGFFDILKDDSVRQGLKVFSDWPTYPQLYINGEFQGGLDIIKETLEEDPDFFKNIISNKS